MVWLLMATFESPVRAMREVSYDIDLGFPPASLKDRIGAEVQWAFLPRSGRSVRVR